MSTPACGRRDNSPVEEIGFKVEQSERALDLGQALGAHVQVTSGGMQRGMPQEALHDGDLDTVFQTVSCKAVPLMPSSA